ncbi:MAG: HEAT repeat domain-containing protein [Candidatus Riflebacteria bacterium]|nr:HEAT repeat domain-containing protein [Candidatus Riflebacteria bacterium]
MSLEVDVTSDLQAPIKSFRIFALEQIIRDGSSSDILNTLEKQQQCEDDDECKLLFVHAIAAVKQRLNLTEKVNFSIDAEAFPQRFVAASVNERLEILFNLPAALIAPLSKWAPDLLEKESNPTVAATIIKIFARRWPKDRVNDITAKLLSESLSIRLAVLEVLIQISPKSLEKFLPKLLISDDPRIRALAIRGLIELDPDEAIAHLDFLLASPERHHKLAAIRNSFFFPFNCAREPILKFLALEKDPDLIEKAGCLFEVNADPEAPFRLADIAQNSLSQKAVLIQNILQNSLNIIQKTGILGDKFEVFQNDFQSRIIKKKVVAFVQEILSKWGMPELEADVELNAVVLQAVQRKDVREAFQQALIWEISDKIKDKIRQYLQPDKPEEVPSIEKNLSWDNLSNEERVRRIAAIDLPSQAENITLLESLSTSDNTPGDLRATAIRASIRLQIRTLGSICERLINSPDVNLASAALEYLGFFDPEKLFHLIGKFLQSPLPRLRMTALRVLQKLDPAQAISNLKAMFFSNNQIKKDNAFSLMVYFDFALIREMLCHFLESNNENKYLDAALCYFQANPDFDNLFILYKIQQNLLGDAAEKVQRVRIKTIEHLQNLGKIEASRISLLEEEFSEKWKKEQEKKKEAIPDYSVKKLFPELPSLISQSAVAILNEFSLRYGIMLPIIFSLGIALFLGMNFLGEGKKAPVKPKGEELLPVETSVSGLVNEVFERGCSAAIQTEKKGKFLVIAKHGEFSEIKPGEKYTFTILPMRKTPDGVIVAYLQKLEK